MKHQGKALKDSGQQAVERLIESDASILDLTGIQVVNIDLHSVVLGMSVTDKMVDSH